MLDLFEELTGARIYHMYIVPGGVRNVLPDGWKERTLEILKGTEKLLHEIERVMFNNAVFKARSEGLGLITSDMIDPYGIVGPNARACGFKRDLRKDEPYLVYDRLDFDIPVGRNGDCYDRYLVRIEQLRQSNRIVRQCIDWLRKNPGPVMLDDNKLVPPRREAMKADMEALIHHFKLFTEGFCIPAGEAYAAVEHPKGEFGVYLVSDGANKPYRLKVRAPGFAHLAAIDEMVRGHMLADVVAVIGTQDIVFGEIDR